VLLAGIALSCSRSKTEPSGTQASAAPPPSPVASAPLAPVSAPPPPEPAPAAKNSVSGDGISIVEAADGTVIFKAKSTFNDVLDTTYENCTFFTKAIPVLKRQLSEEQAKLLQQVCKKP
jgi:hypothetical protein